MRGADWTRHEPERVLREPSPHARGRHFVTCAFTSGAVPIAVGDHEDHLGTPLPVPDNGHQGGRAPYGGA